MKILFLCGSLEPGRDGVGDYTRRLAAECIRQGAPAGIVALNDKGLTTPQPQETVQHDGDTAIRCLRLPQSLPWKARVEAARSWKSDFDPDVLSLQFVPSSFSGRAVVQTLPFDLGLRGQNSSFHIMVHEPYIAAGLLSVRARTRSNSQIATLGELRSALPHAKWTTSIPHYQTLLHRIGIASSLLPLFGNIPILPGHTDLPTADNATTRAVFFGAGPKPSHQKPLIRKLLATWDGPPLTITMLGQPERNALKFATCIERKSRHSEPRITVTMAGVQPCEELSLQFQQAGFGISRSPWRLIGKSGSAISMIEHGLPLWTPMEKQGFKEDDQLFSDLPTLLSRARKRYPRSRLPEVTRRFLQLI